MRLMLAARTDHHPESRHTPALRRLKQTPATNTRAATKQKNNTHRTSIAKAGPPARGSEQLLSSYLSIYHACIYTERKQMHRRGGGRAQNERQDVHRPQETDKSEYTPTHHKTQNHPTTHIMPTTRASYCCVSQNCGMPFHHQKPPRQPTCVLVRRVTAPDRVEPRTKSITNRTCRPPPNARFQKE